MTALAAVSSYLPPQRVTLDELGSELDLAPREVRLFRRFHELAEVRRQPPDGTLLDLLAPAVTGLAGLAGAEDRVRYVLYARSMPVVAPYPANPLAELCRRFGLDRALAFTVTHHACATGLLAVDLAGRLLAADPDPLALALVVAGEQTFTRFARIAPGTTVFGEGAGACLVGRDGPRDRLLAYRSVIRGEFDGRLAEPEQYHREYPDLMAGVLADAVAAAGLGLDDVALILPHNVNVVSWRRVCRRLGFPIERVLLDNVPRVGHVFAADLFINYRSAMRRRLLVPGDRYVIAAAGLGSVFSAMVFEH